MADVATVQARLEQGLERLLESNGFRDYLRVQSRFHAYSFGNALLIWAQRPDATQVAGFNAWREMGRNVRKGEHGIQILAPMARRAQTVTAPDPADPAATSVETHPERDSVYRFRPVRWGILRAESGEKALTKHTTSIERITRCPLCHGCRWLSAVGMASRFPQRPLRLAGCSWPGTWP